MSEPLQTEPSVLQAGDSVSWTRDLPAYPPADGWVLKYRILWRTPPSAAITATASGSAHLVEIPATTTASWQAGEATLVAWVERGTERVTLEQQRITVLADLTSATSLDGRSVARRALDDAQAALLAFSAPGRAGVLEYEIAGRRMKFRELQELQELIAHWRREVAREDQALALAQGVVPGRIYTRM